MKSTAIRKQDSDVTVVRKLIRKEVSSQLKSTEGSSRSANLVQNYAFGSGGGSFGSGSGGGGDIGKITADAYSNGALATVSRGKLQAVGGGFLEDNSTDDAIRIQIHAVNDPMFWLFGV